MRRLAALMLVMAMVLTACASDESEETTTTAGSDGSEETTTTAGSADTTPPDDGGETEEVTLTVSTWTAEAPGWVDWWPETVAAFEEENPGITIEVQQIPFSDLVSSLTTRFVAGEGPDLVHIPLPLTTLPAWADAGFLMNLDDYLAETDVPNDWPDTQASMEWNGTSYGALMQDYGYVLFYNQRMLDAAEVEVPTTVDELVSAAEATTTGDQFGYAVTVDSTVNFLRDVFQFVSGMGTPWISDGAWNFTDPAVVEAVDTWRTMATQYSPQGTDINQKRQAWFNGNAAMMIEGPFILGQIGDNSPAELIDDLHVAQLPFEVPSGDVSNGMSIYSGIPGEKLPMAEAFITHVISESTMESLASSVTNTVARRSANEILAGTPDTNEVVEAAENVGGLLFPAEAQGLRANFSDFQTIASDWFQQLLNTDISVEDAMSGLQSQLEAEGITP